MQILIHSQTLKVPFFLMYSAYNQCITAQQHLLLTRSKKIVTFNNLLKRKLRFHMTRVLFVLILTKISAAVYGFLSSSHLIVIMSLLRFINHFDEYSVFLADKNDGQMKIRLQL